VSHRLATLLAEICGPYLSLSLRLTMSWPLGGGLERLNREGEKSATIGSNDLLSSLRVLRVSVVDTAAATDNVHLSEGEVP